MLNISSISNAELKSLAKDVDNGDDKLSDNELQILISGVTTMQTNRTKSIKTLEENLFDLEAEPTGNVPDKAVFKMLGTGLFSFLSLFAGKKMSKVLLGGAAISLGSGVYDICSYKNEVNKLKKEIELLKNDKNLSDISLEIKEMVVERSGDDSSNEIIKYLSRMDSRPNDEICSVALLKNYLIAVYGRVEDDFSLKYRGRIHVNDAIEILNQYSANNKEE